MRRKKCKPSYRRTVLRLPDLDHSKLAVLNSLTSPASRRVYEYAIDQFTAGTARSLAWLSIASWSCVTACTWNPAVWPRTRSISNSQPCVVWLMKPLTPGC